MNFKQNEQLLERFIKFAQDIISLCNKLPKNLINIELIKQLVRSSCSMGANYSEATEAESAKDFIHKMKIVRKEAKETRFFLRILLSNNSQYLETLIKLGKESMELVKILTSIISKFK